MRDKIEQALVSPGWLRLWQVASGLWVVSMIVTAVFVFFEGVGFGAALLIVAAVALPAAVYYGGMLIRWVIRGFLE